MPAPASLFTSLAFDLGGSLPDHKATTDALAAAGILVEPVKRSRDFNAIYRLTTPPFLAREDKIDHLELGVLRPLDVRRRLVITPHGIALLQWTLDFDEPPRVALCESLYNAIQARKNAAYWRVLHEDPVLYDSPMWDLDPIEHRNDDGGLGASVLLDARDAVSSILEAKRSPPFPMMASRWLLLLRRGACDAKLITARVAEYEQLQHHQAVGTLTREHHAEFSDLTFTHLGGTGSLAEVSDTCEMTLMIAHDLVQSSHHLARSWIWTIDHGSWYRFDEGVYGEDDLQELGRQLLTANEVHQRIDMETLVIDHSNVGFNSTLLRRLVSAMYGLFGTPTLSRLIDERLEIVDRLNQLQSAIIDRSYQEAQRRHGERLQYLFALAAAASIGALVPSLLAVPDDPRGDAQWWWIAIGVLITVWLLLVASGAWLLRVRVDLRRKRS